MKTPSVVILGGGLSGAAVAYTLAEAGVKDVTIVESGPRLGGLAGSFEREGRFYPLGYHHILHLDRPLHYFLDRIGALGDVRWRRIQLLFYANNRLYDLASPAGFLAFPMPLGDKLRFVRLMLHAFRTRDWSAWQDRNAAEVVERYAGAGVRTAMFEPLTRLKFELPCDEVSGAWLGARLHFREGSAPFGYIPGANWTKVLCDGMARLLEEAGVRVLLNQRVTALHAVGGRLAEAELTSGERVGGDCFVNTMPIEVYHALAPRDETPGLDTIRYSALLSVICATRQSVTPAAYWTNLLSPDRTMGGVFLLHALNPTIGAPGDSCINFMKHLRGRDRPLFHLDDDALMARCRDDFRAVFGFELEPFWTNIARVPMYSPIFGPGFRNLPARSATWSNVYFAGNYRTFPSIVSTGTALRSGLDTGAVLLDDIGGSTALPARAAAFRLPGMPRG